MSPTPAARHPPPFPNASLAIHPCRVSRGQHQCRQQPLARGGICGQARVARHIAPSPRGMKRGVHMSQSILLHRWGVDFSLTFMHTRCALQTLCMLGAIVHTYPHWYDHESIFAIGRLHHCVTVHVPHHCPRHSSH